MLPTKMFMRNFTNIATKLSPHFLELGNYKSALNYAKAANWEPCKMELQECLKILEGTGQVDKSIEGAYATFNMAYVNAMLYKYKEAEKFAERLQEIAKHVEEVKELALKAKYFVLLEQDYASAAKYLESLDFSSRNDYGNLCLANTYFMLKDYNKAADQYRLGLLRPTGKIHEAIFNNLAWTQFTINPEKNAELAIEMLKESIANAEPQLRKVEEIQSVRGDPEKHILHFKGNSKYTAIALGNITDILIQDELGEEVRGYWLTLGLKFAEKFAPEYLPRHLMLVSGQYRAKKQYMYAEGLISEAISLETKKKVITGLLVDCYKEYGKMLSEIELRKGEGKKKLEEAEKMNKLVRNSKRFSHYLMHADWEYLS